MAVAPDSSRRKSLICLNIATTEILPLNVALNRSFKQGQA